MKKKKVFKAALSMALSIVMLLGIAPTMVFYAAAKTVDIPVIKDGVLVTSKAERFEESSSGQEQNDAVMTETALTYQIPQIKTTEYDLYTTLETVGNRNYKTFRAGDAEGNIIEDDKLANGENKYFAVQKNLPVTTPTEENVKTDAKALLAERNEDGSLVLVDADNDGNADLSTAMGFVTAETYWNGYLFTAWSFPDSMSADYVTNLVVWDLDDLSKPVATYNLKDLGMLFDWYTDGVDKISSTSAWVKGTVQAKGYTRLNDWAAPTIGGLYVDDDYLVIRQYNWSAWGGEHWDYAQGNQPGGASAGSIDVKLYANPLKTGTKQPANLLGNIKPYTGSSGAQYVIIDRAGTVSSNLATGKRSVLQYNPNMTKVGDYVVEMYPYGAKYYVYKITEGGLEVSKALAAKELNTFLGETAINTQTISDADFDGTNMYLTYTDGTSWTVARVDISNPESPALLWKTDIAKTVSYAADAETTKSTTAMRMPRLDINGDYGVLYDAGDIINEQVCSAKGNWNIILDMSDKNAAPTEVMRYDYSSARSAEYSAYYNYGMERLFGIAYDDYVVNLTSRYNTGKTGISLTKLNADQTAVEQADMMLISDNKNYVVPNGFEEHEGKFFVYLKRNAVSGREAGGKILVYNPTVINAVKSYTVTFYNGDGSVLETQEIEEGKSAAAPQTVPTKASDKEHSYTFSNWDKDFSNITGDLDVYPVFTEGEPVPTYTVTFYNGDGSVLNTQTIDEGKGAIAPSETPTKADNGIYRYTFSDWDKDFSNITENLDVYPVFTESIIIYNVKFCDDNGSVLKNEDITKGDKATAPQYTAPTGYIFKGWALKDTRDIIDTTVYKIESDTTFVPILEYKVTFKDGKGGSLAEVESVGGLITPPVAPTAPEGMSFRGWAVEGSEMVVQFTKAVEPGTIFIPIYGNAKSIKIFTIGHSYGVNANFMLPRVLKEAGYTDITIGMVFAPGCSVENHYKQRNANAVQYYKNTTGDPRDWKTIKDGNEYPFSGGGSGLGDIRTSTAYALKDEDWDIIVMQDGVSQAGRPEDGGYNYYLPLMIDWVKENRTNPDSKLAWHMLWANEQFHANGETSDQQSFKVGFDCDEAVMYNGIIDTVLTKIVPNDNFDYIIPSGTLIQNMRNSYIGDHFCGDSVHLHHQVGNYPVSMLWAEVLAGVDADTIDYIPELDEYQSAQSVQQIDERFLDMAKEAITKTLEEPYKVTMEGPQKLYPRMSIDFGEPAQDGDNYKYTATVYLEQYGNIHGVGAVNNGTSVTDTGNYAGTKIKDWSIDIKFDTPTEFVSAGTADSSLKVVGGYSGGAAEYIAPDMSASYNGGTLSIASSTGGSVKKAYPYYGIVKYFEDGKLALGTFEFTTKTDNFNVELSGELQYGNTYANGSFVEDSSKTTFSTNKTANNSLLIVDNNVMVGKPEIADDPADGLITSEAEIREALSGTLSTDRANHTNIVLGADIVLDDGAETADDLTDGGLIIAGTSENKVYVEISGNYTIKNMQNLKEEYIFDISYADVNITDTVIDANYGNDNRYGEVNTAYGATLIKAENSNVTLNGTATLKNGYVPTNSHYNTPALFLKGGKAVFTMNDNSKITGCRRYQALNGTLMSVSAALIYAEGGADTKVIINGGEISGNELSQKGILHIDDNSGPTVELNSGRWINNDTSKMQYMSSFANYQARGYINGSGMTFDEGVAKFKINSGSPLNISGALKNNINRYTQNTIYNTVAGTVSCFKGVNGYVLTLSDLQKMSTEAYSVDRHPISRVLALDKATNTVYSYVTIDDVPKGAILADGTVVGEVVINDSITDVTEANGSLTVSYQTNPNKTVTGTPIAAIYKAGNLIDTSYDKAENVSLSGNNNTGTIKLDAPSDWATNRGDYRIKFFIWNPLTIAPQIDALEYTSK